MLLPLSSDGRQRLLEFVFGRSRLFKVQAVLGDGTGGLSRNVGSQLPTYALKYPRRGTATWLILLRFESQQQRKHLTVMYVGHLENKERLRMQLAQLFNFS